MNEEQRTSIEDIYANKQEIINEFGGGAEDQRNAQEILKALDLDKEGRERLESKWSIRWSTKSQGKKIWQRTLYQWYEADFHLLELRL